VVTRQLQVECRTAKERWPVTDVLLLSNAGHVVGLESIANPWSMFLGYFCSSERSSKQTRQDANYFEHDGGGSEHRR